MYNEPSNASRSASRREICSSISSRPRDVAGDVAGVSAGDDGLQQVLSDGRRHISRCNRFAVRARQPVAVGRCRIVWIRIRTRFRPSLVRRFDAVRRRWRLARARHYTTTTKLVELALELNHRPLKVELIKPRHQRSTMHRPATTSLEDRSPGRRGSDKTYRLGSFRRIVSLARRERQGEVRSLRRFRPIKAGRGSQENASGTQTFSNILDNPRSLKTAPPTTIRQPPSEPT